MTISVIIPAYQAAEYLPRCIEALSRSTQAPFELIVVDDGSTDQSAALARRAGATVLSQPRGPRGPAAARNRGACEARGNILLFLDADIVVHLDTLARVARHFEAQPDVTAVFGSYDDKPAASGTVSRYRNLLHHFVHQHGRREASTFWAGCGAVRRQAFLDAGGFDECYRRPSIEDIELGGRLREAGYRVWLCPDILVCHLKRWTFIQMVRTDVMDRAVPWTHLILRRGRLPADLNTGMRSRVSAAVVWTAVLTSPLLCWSPVLMAVPVAGLLILCVLNRRLYGFFHRHGSIGFLASAVVLHALYLLYSSAVFASLTARTWLPRLGSRLIVVFASLPRG